MARQGGGRRTAREDDEKEEQEEDEKEGKKGRCNENREKRDGERLHDTRAYSISTEINQGCAQISKRKITKINRPDVRRDKKRDSRSFLSFFPPVSSLAYARQAE